MYKEVNFTFWTNYLKIVSIIFAVMGLMWAVIGSFDPLGIYDQWMAQTFYGQNDFPPDVKKAIQFILAPFGATSMGYFILQYFIAANAYANREKWAYQTIMIAFFAWFILDTILSISHNAWFNVFLANIPALLMMLPVVFTGRYFKS